MIIKSFHRIITAKISLLKRLINLIANKKYQPFAVFIKIGRNGVGGYESL